MCVRDNDDEGYRGIRDCCVSYDSNAVQQDNGAGYVRAGMRRVGDAGIVGMGVDVDGWGNGRR